MGRGWSKNVEYPRAFFASHLFSIHWTVDAASCLRVHSRAHFVPRLALRCCDLMSYTICRFPSNQGNATCFVSKEMSPPRRRGPSDPSGPPKEPPAAAHTVDRLWFRRDGSPTILRPRCDIRSHMPPAHRPHRQSLGVSSTWYEATKRAQSALCYVLYEIYSPLRAGLRCSIARKLGRAQLSALTRTHSFGTSQTPLTTGLSLDKDKLALPRFSFTSAGRLAGS